MSAELLSHVFSSLLNLEKIAGQSRDLLALPGGDARLRASASEQEKILIEMRRTANLLQLRIASGNKVEIHRLMSIFYGLHQMVRNEVHQLYAKLLNPGAVQKAPREIRAHYH